MVAAGSLLVGGVIVVSDIGVVPKILTTLLVFGVWTLFAQHDFEVMHERLTLSNRSAIAVGCFAGAIAVTLVTLRAYADFGEFVSLQYDDSYITYRYAHNFANGDGLRFNPGDNSNSASSLLFVLLLALGKFVSPMAIPDVANILNLSGIFLLSAMPTTYVTKFFGAHVGVVSGIGGSIILGSFPSLVYWTFSGMETAFFFGLLASAITLTASTWKADQQRSRQSPLLYFVLGALCITRVEGAVITFVLTAVILAQKLLRRGRTREVVKESLPLLFLAPLLLGLQLMFYFFYYGSPISDPILFKDLVNYYQRPMSESLSSISRFVTEVSGSMVWMTLLLLAQLLPSVIQRKERSIEVLGAVAVFGGLFVFVLRSPFSDEYRYELALFVPLFFVMVVLVARALYQTIGQPRFLSRVFLSFLVVALFAHIGNELKSETVNIRSRTDTYLYVQQAREDASRWLNENLEDGAVVMSSDIGALSFFSPSLVFLDTAGLVNRTQLDAVRHGADVYGAMRDRNPKYLVDTINSEGLSGVEQILSDPLSYYVPSSNANSSCVTRPVMSKKVLATFPENPPADLRIQISQISWDVCG